MKHPTLSAPPSPVLRFDPATGQFSPTLPKPEPPPTTPEQTIEVLETALERLTEAESLFWALSKIDYDEADRNKKCLDEVNQQVRTLGRLGQGILTALYSSLSVEQENLERARRLQRKKPSEPA